MQTMMACNCDAVIEKDTALFTDDEDDELIGAITAITRALGETEEPVSGGEVFSEAPLGVRTTDELAEGN